MAKKEKITAELTLDVNNFNRRVDDAKKTLQSFGKSTAGKELLGVFGKLAPAIGAVTTGFNTNTVRLKAIALSHTIGLLIVSIPTRFD